jgi:hypothetical protein
MRPSNAEQDIASSVDRNHASSALVEPSNLIRWMERLGVDRNELVNAPLLLCQLQTRCLRCTRKAQCAQTFKRELDDFAWDRWYAYCMNSEILTGLGAMQNCSRAAQYLKFAGTISAG